MDQRELPDLSDWMNVEVITIDEASMLWAAIEPFDHMGISIVDLKGRVPEAQYKKALIFKRAISEGVCAGTLAFVDAWEHKGEWGDQFSKEVEFPNLPVHSFMDTNATRINFSALRKWAAKKSLFSLREQLRRKERAVLWLAEKSEKLGTTLDVEAKIVNVLTLAPPAIHDRSHSRYSGKLSAAVSAWEAEKELAIGLSPKKEWRSGLQSVPNNLALSMKTENH